MHRFPIDTTGRFMGQDFEAVEVTASPDTAAAEMEARSWHPAMEAWGATRFQNRFERLANRNIREVDYQTWPVLRMIGEAATRTSRADPGVIRDYILSDSFDVAGFKGQKLTVRDRDHQVRQPILLTTGLLMTGVSPQDQYLHQTSALDTMGTDRPETTCQF